MQLRLHEVAKLFDVPEGMVHSWIRDERLPARSVNSNYRFHPSELIEWATLMRMPIPAALLREQGNSSTASPSLVDALEAGGIHYELAGTDRPSVLAEVVRNLPQLTTVERDEVLTLLLTREQNQTTAIGDGIAIPHPSRPLVLSPQRPLMALSFLRDGLEWKAPDKEPVRAIFLVIAPNARIHLHLLGQLATALDDPTFRSAVRRQSSRDEILELARRLARSSAARLPPIPV